MEINELVETYSKWISALRLGLQALQCLETLHNQGFIHRDVKPANLAMGATMETKRKVYLLDLGLARQYVLKPRQDPGFVGTKR